MNIEISRPKPANRTTNRPKSQRPHVVAGDGYNGWPSWQHWNVALWINNDEGLYRHALFYRDHYRKARSSARTLEGDHPRNPSIPAISGLDRASKAMLTYLKDSGTMHTPDGAEYTLATIRAAMRDL